MIIFYLKAKDNKQQQFQFARVIICIADYTSINKIINS